MNKGNTLLVVLVTILLAGAIGAAAYFYGQNQSLKSSYMPTVPPSYPSASPYQNLEPTVVPSPTPVQNKVTVVFEADGTFTKAEKDELYKKVINPFTDYYSEPGASTQKLLTITVAKNDKASKDQYPYSVQAVFDGGGTQGFLAMKVGSGIDWWVPECLTKCVLSDAFKAKYPEIAAKVQ